MHTGCFPTATAQASIRTCGSLLHVASENSLGMHAFDTTNTAAVCMTSRQKHQFFFVTANELGSCPEVSLRISSSVTFTNVGTHVILNQYDT